MNEGDIIIMSVFWYTFFPVFQISLIWLIVIVWETFFTTKTLVKAILAEILSMLSTFLQILRWWQGKHLQELIIYNYRLIVRFQIPIEIKTIIWHVRFISTKPVLEWLFYIMSDTTCHQNAVSVTIKSFKALQPCNHRSVPGQIVLSSGHTLGSRPHRW